MTLLSELACLYLINGWIFSPSIKHSIRLLTKLPPFFILDFIAFFNYGMYFFFLELFLVNF